MLGNVAPTPYDLRFYIFGIFTRVHPFFWLMGFLMGWPRRGNPWPEILGTSELMIALVWALCVFVSILVHELGHALTAKYFGWQPEIVLYHFGGLAMYVPTWGNSTKRSILVTLNGPNAGFVLYGIVVAVQQFIPLEVFREKPALMLVFSNLEFINLYWGLMNLLPVYPLDGGRICQELLIYFKPRVGHELSLKISIITGGCVAVWAFSAGATYMGVLFAVLAYNCFQMLQRHQRGPW